MHNLVDGAKRRKVDGTYIIRETANSRAPYAVQLTFAIESKWMHLDSCGSDWLHIRSNYYKWVPPLPCWGSPDDQTKCRYLRSRKESISGGLGTGSSGKREFRDTSSDHTISVQMRLSAGNDSLGDTLNNEPRLYVDNLEIRSGVVIPHDRRVDRYGYSRLDVLGGRYTI